MKDQEQKSRLDELQQYMIPATKYFWISGPEIAVHKDFIKYYTPAILVVGVVLTLLTEHTNFWAIVASGVWELLFVRGYMVTIPVILIAIGVLYVQHRRSKKQKQQNSLIEARRRKLDELVGGG